MAGFHPPARLDEPLSKMEEIMQNFVRRMLGFVTQVLAPSAPADTAIADEAWWQGQIKGLADKHYRKLGDWWMEEVSTSCICCKKPVTIARWQTSNEGDECNDCIQMDANRYEADEDQIKDAMGVKISF